MAANLFSARVITMGTLIAVFLSTSDEMLPIMLSEKTNLTSTRNNRIQSSRRYYNWFYN